MREFWSNSPRLIQAKSAIKSPPSNSTSTVPSDGTALTFLSVSVAVICMSGVQYLTRCIESLRRQQGAPEFEIVVASAPTIPDIEVVCRKFPEIRIVVNHGQRTPLELASLAVRKCSGDLILVTKDHCVPRPDWVRIMLDAQREGRAVVGGRIEINPDASPTEWAYLFIDFFRYAMPLVAGPTSFLTVCNVAYKKNELDKIRGLWDNGFVEATVNNELRTRFGALWLTPSSQVTMYRNISLRHAIYERYAYGRLFASSRLSRWSRAQRFVYVIGAPLLPVLLLGRMVRVAIGSRRNRSALVKSLGPLMLMLLARCWGEWLGYVTGRCPPIDDPAQMS